MENEMQKDVTRDDKYLRLYGSEKIVGKIHICHILFIT